MIDDHDYKAIFLEQDALREQNSKEGWIYIGICEDRLDRFKVGMTAGKLQTRASSTNNPSYTLLWGFKVRQERTYNDIRNIETSLKRFLDEHYTRIPHVETQRPSEWFWGDPFAAHTIVDNYLFEKHSMDMYCYYDSEYQVGVIMSWRNSRYLDGGERAPYRSSDHSEPRMAFECAMPPGCGMECDCWG